ncbi:hypothetical protein ACWIVU_08095 [Ursidibacter arcticus]
MKLQKILKNLPLVFILLNTSGQILASHCITLNNNTLDATNVKAGGSGSSTSAQFSQNKAKVDYAQVTQQSGFNCRRSNPP